MRGRARSREPRASRLGRRGDRGVPRRGRVQGGGALRRGHRDHARRRRCGDRGVDARRDEVQGALRARRPRRLQARRRRRARERRRRRPRAREHTRAIVAPDAATVVEVECAGQTGRIIGTGGSKIREIEELTGCILRVRQEEGVCEVSGRDVNAAVQEIKNIVQEGRERDGGLEKAKQEKNRADDAPASLPFGVPPPAARRATTRAPTTGCARADPSTLRGEARASGATRQERPKAPERLDCKTTAALRRRRR